MEQRSEHRIVKNFWLRIWAVCAPGISDEQAANLMSNRTHRTHNRVLLVHGIADSAASMRMVQQRLARDGRECQAITLKGADGSVSLEKMSLQLRDYIQDHFSPTERLDLVGFSMGGLVCRHYIQMLGGNRRVDRLVTISTPNQGTLLAFLNARGGMQANAPRQRLSTGAQPRLLGATRYKCRLLLDAMGIWLFFRPKVHVCRWERTKKFRPWLTH